MAPVWSRSRPGLADVVVSSCYKWLLGTQGIALFYRDPQRLGGLEPPIVGWHSRAGPSEPHRPSHHPCGGGGPLDALSLAQPDVWTAPDHAGRFEAANVSYLSAYLLEQRPGLSQPLPGRAAGGPQCSAYRAGAGWIRPARAGGHHARAAGAAGRQCDLRGAQPASTPVRWPPGSRRKECWCGVVTAACACRVTCTTMKRMSSACWRSCPPPSRRPDHHEHWYWQRRGAASCALTIGRDLCINRKRESTSPCGAGGP